MLDVRRLQVLRSVVTSGSVTAAAAELGYTPSAVSQQVAALERETGTALLERVGRGVRPTPAGRLLTEHASLIGTRVAEAETALADLRAGRTGRLSVRYFATAGAALVAPAVARFLRACPDVQVDLRLSDPGPWGGGEDVLAEVREGRTDLAVVVGPPPPGPGLRVVRLLDDPYRAVLPLDHPLAARVPADPPGPAGAPPSPPPPLPLAALADEPWVRSEWPSSPCFRIVREACAAAGFTPRFVVESEDHATAQGFVAAGLGVTLVPDTGLSARHPGVAVRELAGTVPVREICAVVRTAALDGQPALGGLVEALSATAASVRGSARPVRVSGADGCGSRTA